MRPQRLRELYILGYTAKILMASESSGPKAYTLQAQAAWGCLGVSHSTRHSLAGTLARALGSSYVEFGVSGSGLMGLRSV